MNNDFVVGRFIREEKNRFLCTVEVDGKEEECYIPSSCRLENFLKLAGKEVFLKENKSKNTRTHLMVYAIRFKRNYLILRPSEANELIMAAVHSRRFAFLKKRSQIEKERVINGYKADLYIPDTKTVIEIKSIITVNKQAVFPTVFSERALDQLNKLEEIIKDGYMVVYLFVVLNPYVGSISLSKEEHLREYKRKFYDCVKKGMKYRGYSVRIQNSEPIIDKEIKVIL